MPIRVTLKDAWCVNALEKEADYLLSLEQGRLLAGFYENSGLKTPYVRYGGWESGLIGGHTLGHYLSALAFASTNTAIAQEKRARLFAKMEACVNALGECQQALGTGFLWGAPRTKDGYPEAQFDHVEQGKTNIKKEAWVPWYTLHKILAGLIDAYAHGSESALGIASRLGDWVYRRVSRWDKRLRKKVLSVEYGGMNDCLYELFSYTGKETHAAAAHIFDEEPLFDEILTEGKDVLNDRHANTTIPKIVGALKRYVVLHGRTLGGKQVDASRYLAVAEAFFRMVTERHTYVTGGNSEWERFGEDYVLDRERTNCNCETCNVYNMLKLARLLFCVTGEKRYTDYYDNAFTNTILSSQNPETGMTTYFQPMASGFFKVYSTPFQSFWCCTGSGMESLSKLGDSVCYVKDGEISVEQYLSSEIETENCFLRLTCDFPFHERGILKVERAKQPFTVRLRIPDWADGEIAVGKNGIKIPVKEENGHVSFPAEEGDVFLFAIPVAVTLKGLPDGGALAFCYGGAVLSADLGEDDMEETTTGVDVSIPARRGKETDCVYFDDLADVLEYPQKYLKRREEEFILTGGDRPLTFRLHYRRNYGRYALYLRLREGKEGCEDALREPFDAVRCGYGQYESDALHALSEHRSVSETGNASSRRAMQRGWFSYDMKVDPAKKNVLSVTLRSADNGKNLKISAEGETVFDERLFYCMGDGFYQREIAIPPDILLRARTKTVDGRTYRVLNIRFEGGKGRASARVCGSLHMYLE